MCGFSVYDKNDILSSSAIKRSEKFVQFRGCDDTQVYESEQHVFIHHRLSIVDKRNGSQPLVDNNGILVFNGEIHNYQSLGKKYFDRIFTGDSQFLFTLCLHSRFDILSEIDGYFAFVYYNVTKRNFYVARDLYGEKPLYASKNLKNFSSSLNDVAVLRKKTINQKIKSLFAQERVEWQNILFDDFFEVPANTIYNLDSDGKIISHKRIYSLTKTAFDNQKFMRSFNSAVQDRLIADVPVAQSLSGGKDSGLINIALIQKNLKIPRFTIKNTNSEVDESSFVQNIADKYELPLTQVTPKKCSDVDEFVKTLVYQEVPPWDFSFIGFYQYYQQVARSAKVIIEGHGPDELHGGYQDYILVKLIESLLGRSTKLREVYKELRTKTGRSIPSLIFSTFLFIVRGKIFRKKEYINLSAYWKMQEKRLHSVLSVFDRVTMHAQVESRSPFLSYKMMPYFEFYRNSNHIGHITKPYITSCISAADDDYPILAKKIGFTFGNNDKFSEYAILILRQRQLTFLKLSQVLLPKKMYNRLVMYEIFYAAHMKFRSWSKI